MANDDDTRDAPDTRSTHRGDRSGDYEVGYGRPPKETRFRPGQSGNPRGRPKKSAQPEVTFEEMLARVARRPAPVRRGDQIIEIPKIEAVYEKMYAVGAKGNVGALKELLRLALHCDAAVAARRGSRSTETTEIDREIIERHFRRRSGVTDDEGDDHGDDSGDGEDA